MRAHEQARREPRTVGRSLVVVALLATVFGGAGATTAEAAVDVTGVQGLAFNYYADISLFGGPKVRMGYGQTAPAVNTQGTSASPSAQCPATGGGRSMASPGAKAVYGPATVFSGIWPQDNSTAPPSGPLLSVIDCQLGRSGHVNASTSVTLEPPGTTWTPPGSLTPEPYPGGVGPDTFVADEVRSSCSATAAGTSGSTTIVNGHIQTDDDPFTTEPAPTTPDPNYTRTGTVVNDSFRIVLNEQIVNADGSLTVNAMHEYMLGPTAVGDLVVGSSTCGPLTKVTLPGGRTDFDGNGADELAVFRPSNGAWYSRDGLTRVFGTAGDAPVPGDYDGGGSTDVAVFRPSNGVWYFDGGSATAWGTDGDLPVPGDYDGNGITDVAVFRPSNGVWFVKGGASTAWGTTGDIPVTGDYDGDGKTDLAVFRPSNGVWYVHPSASAEFATAWGTSGDVPVPGDYNGDGRTDLAVFRPSTGVWFVNGGPTTAWGTNGDIPAPADFDGDGTTEIAVFRPSNGVWFRTGSAIPWGTNGDAPLPLAPAIRMSLFP